MQGQGVAKLWLESLSVLEKKLLTVAVTACGSSGELGARVQVNAGGRTKDNYISKRSHIPRRFDKIIWQQVMWRPGLWHWLLTCCRCTCLSATPVWWNPSSLSVHLWEHNKACQAALFGSLDDNTCVSVSCFWCSLNMDYCAILFLTQNNYIFVQFVQRDKTDAFFLHLSM